jgi:folate-dependent phosphoribosylglycinamide formyltransferase PurN
MDSYQKAFYAAASLADVHKFNVRTGARTLALSASLADVEKAKAELQRQQQAAKEKIAGCTVHYVSCEIDGGEIILQKSVAVDSNETPWQLGGRIFLEENKLLVEAVRLLRTKHSTAGTAR